MRISLKILESEKEIVDMILSSLINHIKPKIPNLVRNIKQQLPSIIVEALVKEPEYQSLKNGQLRYEFGIPDTAVVDNIINLWANNFYIKSQPISKTNNQVKYSLFIGMIEENFDDVLSTNDSVVYDTVSGIFLPWLEWLLLEGGKILVRNYQVRMGPNPRSRTGMAVMVQSKKNWRVPNEFAGTVKNNWVTRALGNIDDQLVQLIKKETGKIL